MSVKSELAVFKEGSGMPIVLLHGQISSHHYWQRVASFLTNNQLVLPDLLGFGQSPKPEVEYTVEDHLAALERSLKNVQKPFLLVGHSMGAQLAVAYARKHPKDVRGLVLSAMPCFPDSQGYKYLAKEFPRFRPLLKGRFAKHACDWHLKHQRRAEKLTLRFAGEHKSLPPDVLTDTLKHTWSSFHKSMENIVIGYDAWQDLEQLKLPVELIIGEQDYISNLGIERARHMDQSNIKLRIIPKAKHNLPLLCPHEVAEVIQLGYNACQ